MRLIVLTTAILFLTTTPILSGEETYQIPSREELCKEIINNYQCAQEIEKVWLSILKDKIKRNGGALILTLHDGSSVSRTDTSEKVEGFYDSKEEPHIWYTFDNYLKQDGYYVLRLQYYEGISIELINMKTGESAIIPERPLISPDRDYFVVQNPDDYDPVTYGIYIWSITDSNTKKVWSYKPKDWPLIRINWTDPTTIEIRCLAEERDGILYNECDRVIANIKLVEDKWIINEYSN